jgi:predicted molibdopterin-dependent oxidoreductase YjgC
VEQGLSGTIFEIQVDGRTVTAMPGDSVAAALLRAGVTTFSQARASRPLSIFCGMGVCFGCLVSIDDLPDQRACVTTARPGMRVQTQLAEVI